MGSAWGRHPQDMFGVGWASLGRVLRGVSIPGLGSAWGEHPQYALSPGVGSVGRAPRPAWVLRHLPRCWQRPQRPQTSPLSPGSTSREAGEGARTAPAKQDGELCGTGVPSSCGVPGAPLCPEQGEPPSSAPLFPPTLAAAPALNFLPALLPVLRYRLLS